VTQDIYSTRYALIFDQNGLMAGAGIQGSKISKIDNDLLPVVPSERTSRPR